MTNKLLHRFSSVTLNHVKDHQNDHVRVNLLPLETRLIVDCNLRAKAKMRAAVCPTDRKSPALGHGATHFIGYNEGTIKMEEQ